MDDKQFPPDGGLSRSSMSTKKLKQYEKANYSLGYHAKGSLGRRGKKIRASWDFHSIYNSSLLFSLQGLRLIPHANSGCTKWYLLDGVVGKIMFCLILLNFLGGCPSGRIERL